MADDPKTPAEQAQEVFDLVKAYTIQETATPLQGLGRYLKFGIPGALCLGVGFFFLALAGLRGLQEIDNFNGGEDGLGWLVFVPYLIVFVVAAAVLGFLATRITKGLDQ